jgi:hypothetical protein
VESLKTTTSPEKLLEKLYPGKESLILELRRQLLEASYSPGLTTVLLEGPPGSGKTTIARALAMARMLAKVSPSLHKKSIDMAVKEVRTGSPPFRWYKDISLAGLSDTLAERQLFGIGQKIATGADPSIGIFELAITGCIDQKSFTKTHKDLYSENISLVTGGVVLLDEIGDLSDKLQAKLLRTLNGEVQYRVGLEGIEAYGFKFGGLAILATWKNIDSLAVIREDLRQRICQHRISIPPLSKYPSTAREAVIRNAINMIQNEYREELIDASFIEDKVGMSSEETKELFNPEWKERINQSIRTNIKDSDIKIMTELDWSKLGEFRGLRNFIKKILSGNAIEKVLLSIDVISKKEPSEIGESTTRVKPLDVINREEQIVELEQYIKKGISLSEAWQKQRSEWAKKILQELHKGSWQLNKTLEETEKNPKKFKKELANIIRSKKRINNIN